MRAQEESVKASEPSSSSRPAKTFKFVLDRIQKTWYEDELKVHERTFVARDAPFSGVLLQAVGV